MVEMFFSLFMVFIFNNRNAKVRFLKINSKFFREFLTFGEIQKSLIAHRKL